MGFCDIKFRRKSDGTIEVKDKRGEISPLYSKLVEYTKQNDVYQGREWFFDKLVEQGKLKTTDNNELSLGLYSIAYHSNKSEGYWINKIEQLLPDPFYPQEGINSSFIKPDQSIEYKLKLINALDKINRNIFEQSKLQGWVNDLSRFGTPKEQIELFKEIAKEGMSKNDIISSLLATFSFDVQINTSKGNTQYYSNLTVPGGTNYTENEISIPVITPSIKGHAQFSTDQGIGWFRSDEQTEKGTYKDFNKEFQEKRYQEYINQGLSEEVAINRAAMDSNFENPELLGTEGTPTKTRRILEVQSDWGQKQRKSFEPDINVKYDIQQIINDLQKSGDLKINCN